MALPMLVGGSECGPSNALQGLTKRFDQDRGLQQDYFGAARAGSSREAFRTQNASTGRPDQDAQRFFAQNASGGGAQLAGMSDVPAFDVSAMRAALPHTPVFQQPQAHTPQTQHGTSSGASASSSSWATDFMMQASAPSTLALSGAQQQANAHVQPAVHGVSWNPAMSPAYRMNAMPTFMPQIHAQPQPSAAAVQQISWDKEFSVQEENLATSSVPLVEVQPTQETQQESAARKEFEGDELARTAGLLLEQIKHEQNPKFQKSQFLGLMKQLRDGEVIVDGNKVVESDGTRTSAAKNVDVKGKRRAFEPMAAQNNVNGSRAFLASQGPLSQHTGQQATESQQPQTTEDPNDAYFRQENEEYTKYWSEAENQRQAHDLKLQQDAARLASMNATEWDRLQEDWDTFEATSSGIKPLAHYTFQANNPYLLGETSRHHMLHTNGERQAMLENVLELEAAVQRDPTNAELWYELGVKQQENEREGKALQALRRSVELDPSHLPARLALAISYTNDNDRQGTYESITEWINRNDKYREAADAFRARSPVNAYAPMGEKFSNLIQCLIAMATSNVTGEIDADIQIALAVLLNTNEEYEKAKDCFTTALAVRPDDWLLYNRVGATMANSGRPEEALLYYYKALELNPGYIRARFNLGISCMNLRRYDEAAQHILDALSLQESDTTDFASVGDREGSMSTALWDSLRTTCLHLQRPDLATICDSKDIEAFRKQLYN